MIIQKCNRCGKIAEDEKQFNTMFIPRNNLTDMQIDLCPECWTAYYEQFMKMKKPGSVKERGGIELLREAFYRNMDDLKPAEMQRMIEDYCKKVMGKLETDRERGYWLLIRNVTDMALHKKDIDDGWGLHYVAEGEK